MKTAVKVLFFLSRCCFYLFSLINEKFGNALQVASSFILYVFMLRILKAKGFGVYFVFTSVSSLISTFLDFGVPLMLNKYLPNEKNPRKLLGDSILFVLTLDLILFLLFFPFVHTLTLIFFKNKKYEMFLLLAYANSIILTLDRILLNYLFLQELFEQYKRMNKIISFLRLLYYIPSIYFYGYVGAVFSYMLTNAILLAFLWYNCKPVLLGKRVIRKSMIKYMFKVNILTGVGSLQSWLDSIIISILLGFEGAGLYGLANQIYNVFLRLVSPSNALKRLVLISNYEGLTKILKKTLKLLILTTILLELTFLLLVQFHFYF
jgi:O-antigen/teichoic acid export membrane protein